jgi:hypothetical protein
MKMFSLGYGKTRVVFDEVKAVGTRYETIDGKRLRRQKTFYETVNPFNKDADGAIKSRLQVQESVRAKARAWENALP